MHDMHEATEVLLQTAREYGSSNALGGDVVAAAYRLVATHVREHGYTDLSRDLEKKAAQAERHERMSDAVEWKCEECGRVESLPYGAKLGWHYRPGFNRGAENACTGPTKPAEKNP